jgi:hypothetical protein
MTDNPRREAVALPLHKLRPIWKAHGGAWHGPHVEHWTIPEANVEAVFSAALAAADAAALPDDIAGLVGRLRKDVDNEMSAYAADIQHGADYPGSVPEYVALTIKDALAAAAALERQAREIERLRAGDHHIANFVRALAKAREVLESYADPAGHTDNMGEPYSADDETHPGLLARAAITEIDALKAGDAPAIHFPRHEEIGNTLSSGDDKPAVAPAPVVTDDMVEAGAKAIFALYHDHHKGGAEGAWDREVEKVRDAYREQSRAALTAALTPQEQSDDG